MQFVSWQVDAVINTVRSGMHRPVQGIEVVMASRIREQHPDMGPSSFYGWARSQPMREGVTYVTSSRIGCYLDQPWMEIGQRCTKAWHSEFRSRGISHHLPGLRDTFLWICKLADGVSNLRICSILYVINEMTTWHQWCGICLYSLKLGTIKTDLRFDELVMCSETPPSSWNFRLIF